MPKMKGYKSTDHIEGKTHTGNNKNYRKGCTAPSGEKKGPITMSNGGNSKKGY